MERISAVGAHFCSGRKQKCCRSEVRPFVPLQSRREALLVVSVGNLDGISLPLPLSIPPSVLPSLQFSQ